MTSSASPSEHDSTTVELHRVARWKHRVTVPLGQVLGLLDLVEDVASPAEKVCLDSTLSSLRDGAQKITGRLNDLLNHQSKEPITEKVTSLVTELGERVSGLESDCRKALEAMPVTGSDVLRADILALNESLVRLHRAIDGGKPADDSAGAVTSLVAQNEKSSGTMTPFAASQGHEGARLLLVDDDRMNLKVIGRRLERMGFTVITADRGVGGLEILERAEVDLVMLDILMPELDGFATLERIRNNARWRDLPVIMLTALDDAESTARCLASGADDYVSKPFDETVLRARIEVALDRKRLRDKERKLMERVRAEKHVSENLLHSILPQSIANRLREGEEQLVDRFTDASVVFIDIVGFTLFAATYDPEETVALLNDLFSRFDRLVESHGMEKIKTIGDAYLAVAGVPEMVSNHAGRAANLALAVHNEMESFNTAHGIRWSVRIGVASGPLVAGIIGSRKFAYDLWGDTVNVASRLESMAQPDETLLTAETAASLDDTYAVEQLPDMDLHNRGQVQVFRLTAASESLSSTDTEPRFG